MLHIYIYDISRLRVKDKNVLAIILTIATILQRHRRQGMVLNSKDRSKRFLFSINESIFALLGFVVAVGWGGVRDYSLETWASAWERVGRK